MDEIDAWDVILASVTIFIEVVVNRSVDITVDRESEKRCVCGRIYFSDTTSALRRVVDWRRWRNVEGR